MSGVFHGGRIPLTGLLLMALAATYAPAQLANPFFVAPSDATGPFEEVSWTRGDELSLFAAFENFRSATAPNEPALPPQGPLGPGNTPAPILPEGFMATVTNAAGGGFITSTENIYTGDTVGEFEVFATGFDFGAGFDTRVVLQVGSLGGLQAADSFKLEYTDASDELVVLNPIGNILLNESAVQGGPFGGIVQDRAIVFEIAGFSPADLTLTFDSAGDNFSLSTVVLDVLVSPAEVQLAGDYSGDGLVGLDDYQLLRDQFGTAGPDADGNGDGIVDAADYTVWRDNLGATTAAASAVIAVPEPSSGQMLVMVAISVAFCSWVFSLKPPRIPRG